MYMETYTFTEMIITLHVADRKFACGHTVREITLGSDSDVDIGRASKDTKKNLVADVDNALFDCAVMSRKHALLSTATEDGEVSLTFHKRLHRELTMTATDHGLSDR